jgi:tetratricopeptide (TPR) repeat protein
VKRALPFLFLTASPLLAQVPQAQAVDPALGSDAGNDFFLRGKNLYDAAQVMKDPDVRVDFFQRSGDIFADYLNNFPNHPNADAAWWYLGNAYLQSGHQEEGKRCFTTLLNRFGNGKWAAAAAYTLAADHYNRIEYASAAPLFERFAANAPKPEDRPKGHYYAGNCYRQLGREREAIAAFQRVIGDPAGGLFAPQANVALGYMFVKSGKLPEGLAQFEKVIATASYAAKTRGEAALQAALVATKLSQTDVADKYLQLILATPGMEEFRPDAQTALMGNFFAKKQYREAIEIFRRSNVKTLGEKEATRQMIAAQCYVKLGQPAEALDLFREVEKLVTPESNMAFEASYSRLLCFFQIEGHHVPDQVDAFLQLYRKSHASDPRIHTALLMKAETLFSGNETAAAAKAYSEVNASLLTEKNKPGLFYQRGWCLSEAGDAQGALRSLNEFITQYPQDPRFLSALAKRAKAYADTAEPEKAIADFDKLTVAGTPDELSAFAWLESARVRRTGGNIPDMIVRYEGLLKNAKALSPKLEGEANYFIGWGRVKTNVPKDAVPFLEKARTVCPETYRKPAGLLLALGYFAGQDAQKLASEINLAITGDYADEILPKAVQWSGMQSYNAGDYAAAAKCFALISSPDDPAATAKEVWRYLAKSLLETKDPSAALVAVDFCLEAEESAAWKADGLVDRGRALFMLGKFKDARKAADEAIALRPQGHTAAGLNLLDGDLLLKAGDAKTASGKYLVVIEFHTDDKELMPLALWKNTAALDQQGDKPGAEKYRQQLKTQYPDWKAPTR